MGHRLGSLARAEAAPSWTSTLLFPPGSGKPRKSILAESATPGDEAGSAPGSSFNRLNQKGFFFFFEDGLVLLLDLAGALSALAAASSAAS